MKTNVAIVIPNWNGAKIIGQCIESLMIQSLQPHIIVVDNGSSDDSCALISSKYEHVELIQLSANKGFAGGVNTGIQSAIQQGFAFIGLLNNDAVVKKHWLKNLHNALSSNKSYGSATGLIMDDDDAFIDNTGDGYSTWGLTISSNRGLPPRSAPNKQREVFGACAGACLYRAKAINSVGLFDKKFFAYYEDTDINFRLQLAGWKTVYEPKATTQHATGSTSKKIKGFTTYHTMKNLPMLFWKNVPWRYVPHIFPRLFLAYWTIMIKSIFTGKAWPALKGHTAWLKNIPHTFRQRRRIQASKTVSNDYIWSILTHDLPPNARNLRKLRYIASLGRIKP